ncbi:K0226 protein [Salmo salar]|uniref:K0226 protein n=1 Tax=Salmo salar TaxID=8030 RepID=B5XE70_SALSA|nr:K0226 protein [Salmo salar]ACI69140.1 KIAA0226 [Salmo salar]|eukprot:NP_001134849.1 K0226 protein [Salmo salar]
MEITAEAEAEERRREHWKLLSSLKTTVEGLVSTNNPNVWSRYGGLQRLHKDMNHILSHGLKHEQVYYKQKDYWPFVCCVRYISPHLASHVEQVLYSSNLFTVINHPMYMLVELVQFVVTTDIVAYLHLHRTPEKTGELHQL